jgi:hypothetical protein
MPVVIVVLLLLPPDGRSEILVNPVGTTMTGKPTRLPMHTFSQSVAFPMNASTVKDSLISLISLPRARCACMQ